MQVYKSCGDIAKADSIIGLSFGTVTEPGGVNAQLADLMLELADGRPMIADRMLVDAMPDGDALVSHVVEGPITNIKAQGLGTWGTFLSAQQYMQEKGLHSPLLVAQAYHVTRSARQAAKLGIQVIMPEGLPRQFDWRSKQLWTKSVWLWIPCNTLGSLLLKQRGRL
jgi:hypothetical protein